MPDQQAGHEKTLTALLPALSGCNLIYGMGMLELGMTFSIEQLIIDNEIAGMVKRVIKGIDVNDETLAVELIKKIGPGKDFLSQKHTREYMSTELSKVNFFDRRMRDTWIKKGSKELVEKAKEKAHDILENHRPDPLPPKVASALRKIVEETQEEVKSK